MASKAVVVYLGVAERRLQQLQCHSHTGTTPTACPDHLHAHHLAEPACEGMLCLMTCNQDILKVPQDHQLTKRILQLHHMVASNVSTKMHDCGALITAMQDKPFALMTGNCTCSARPVMALKSKASSRVCASCATWTASTQRPASASFLAVRL